MGDGKYSKEQFISGWNHGNTFSYEALLAEDNAESKPFSLPTQLIEQYWQWNKQRNSLQQKLGDDIFVPRVMFVNYNGQLKATAVWPDAIPIALPEVDLLFIPRDELAPKKFFMKQPDHAVIPFSNVDNIISNFPQEQEVLPYRLVKYKKPPSEILAFVKSLKPFEGQLEALSTDQILNQELVEKYYVGS